MLKISDQLSLPLDAITSTFAIMAMRGVGKTSLASVMAEEMLKAGQPIVAYDPTGAWFGLKSSSDGKRKGFPVVIFGGEHADVPLEESAGETIARVIVERRVPAVLDVSLMRKGARIRFMMSFCEMLYHINREPLHLFLDEAHTVCPKDVGKFGEKGLEPNRLLGAVEDIVLQGRRKGLGITVISQRPALVNANVRTQCATLMAMRLMAKLDITAVKEWIESHASVDEAKEMLGSLATLKVGEGWVWSPSYLKVFSRVQFRRRETFDSSATPEIGKRVVTPKVVAEIDLAALGEEIKATVEKAKSDDPRDLKRKISELTKQVQALETQLAEQPDVEPERIEVPVLTADNLIALAEHLAELKKSIGLTATIGAALADVVTGLAEAIGESRAKATLAKPSPARPTSVPRPPVKRSSPARQEGSADISAAGQKILDALAWWEMVGRQVVDKQSAAFAAGYTVNGHFNNTLGSLRTSGLIDYPQGGTVALTEAGRGAANYPDSAGTLEDLHEAIRSKLSAAQERIINLVITEHPTPHSKEWIAEAAGYTVNGHFNNVLGSLRTLGLITKRGDIAATDVLFPEALS